MRRTHLLNPNAAISTTPPQRLDGNGTGNVETVPSDKSTALLKSVE
jgi:hypothetical protein